MNNENKIRKLLTRYKMLTSVENSVVRYGMFNDKNFFVSYMFKGDTIKHSYYRLLIRHMMVVGERFFNRNIKKNSTKNNDINIAYDIGKRKIK